MEVEPWWGWRRIDWGGGGVRGGIAIAAAAATTTTTTTTHLRELTSPGHIPFIAQLVHPLSR